MPSTIRWRAPIFSPKRAPFPRSITRTSAPFTKSANPTARPYLAMEFIEGHTLSMEITSVGMATDIVVRYGQCSRRVVARARTRHRSPRSESRQCDRHAFRPAESLRFRTFPPVEQKISEETTQFDKSWDEQNSITGTLPYIAPELLRGQSADPRSDHLGAGLLSVRNGRRPPAFSWRNLVRT